MPHLRTAGKDFANDVRTGERRMIGKFGLRTKLLGAFILLSITVLVVAYIGWHSSSRLIKDITHIEDSVDGLVGIWKIHDALTQMASGEYMLVSSRLSQEQKQKIWESITKSASLNDEGQREYESTSHTAEEERLYKQFLRELKMWMQHHEEFIQMYREYEKLDIQHPWKVQVELLNQGLSDSTKMKSAKEAAFLLDELNTLVLSRNSASFSNASQSLLSLTAIDERIAEEAKVSAERDVRQTKYWMILAMILGPGVAIGLGIILSFSLSKPISSAVNSIVSTAAEMAAMVEQHERVTAQQAAAVNETTATMDELEASFRQSAEQAEVAATRARQALTLTEEGTSAVRQTLEGMSSLKSKVEAVAEQILRLSEQTSQISNITNLVSELANQTNLLALNAAVEAARAGEHGKGFAVVAAEIRKLADQSKKSAERINTLVLDIQNATNSTVMATEEGTKTVEAGTHLTRRTAEVFDGLAESISNVSESSQQTLLNVKQQVAAVRQVVEAMDAINNGSKETATGITQTRIGVQQLNDAAESLQIIV
jgi:methyl-accepting chemotaxis protein